MSANPSLVDELMSQLQGAPLQQIAQGLGTDTAQAQSAVSAALPMMLGALGNNTQSSQGADALFGALQRDHTGGGGLDLGGLLGAVLGGGAAQAAPQGAQGDSAGILGHIFGGQQDQASGQLGQATGLGDNAGKLLAMLAPIVMSFLAQRVMSGGMNSSDLGSALGQEQANAQQQGGVVGDILGSLLGGGGGLADLIKIGGSLLGKR
ncbi:DUF937 domain-containing protein [Comamonas humi]